jgi:hypothetical protein
MAKTSHAPLRTLIVRVTIVSFSVAALLGVMALLSGGTFGSNEARILLTTLLVGVVSVHVLCYLATAEGVYRPVGVAGGAAVLVPLVAGLSMIWADWWNEVPIALGRTFGVGSVVAVSLAQACLLFVVATGRGPLVRGLLAGTLVVATVLGGLVSALILGFEPQGSAYARLVGVVAIFDVLGTVVVAALAKFGGPGRENEAVRMVVPPDLAALVTARADALGQRPEDYLRDVLEHHEGP